jgi:uncharacterized membrane protein YedE/YeeE
MIHRITEYLIGLLFGLGLIVAGMTDPGKVLAFLDLAGAWDPSLAFVMGGAILVASGAFAIAKRRNASLLGDAMRLPTRRDLDAPLVAGSLLFGAGWGLAGFCPGPALAVTGAGAPKAAAFVVAMLAGMWIYERIESRSRAEQTAPTGM